MPSPPLVATLLIWAEGALRDLPWRRTRDPWAILVAETMLQQTQVARVAPKWQAFMGEFPDAVTCARAPRADIIRRWAGLGYNRRAVHLHRAAQTIAAEHDGEVPDELDRLLALPGVGPYTARAVLAFAFERPVAPVDTNIGRVLARVGGAPLSPSGAQQWADELVPWSNPWLWNQGLMELGATLCTKRSPSCGTCPVAEWCGWRGEGCDPAVGSAAVSAPQSRFEGSDRQLRGRLVDAVRDGPVSVDDIAAVLGVHDAERVARTVETLVEDGLVQVRRGRVSLGR